MVILQLLGCNRPGASHTVSAVALKTCISIHSIIFSKYMLKHTISVNESIMNVAPQFGLAALKTTLSQARNFILMTLNQLHDM